MCFVADVANDIVPLRQIIHDVDEQARDNTA